MKATSIVDGIQKQSGGDIKTIHLNLLGKAGREVGAAYGIKIIPATVVLDRHGSIRYRNNGFPERGKILQIVTG